ncbi:MAG: multidrug efflux RND transporter permease subunit [Methylophilaceae bacterium]|nr:multidrug efflux RND transporter permease subunit [Methylophilaceae bacterium]
MSLSRLFIYRPVATTLLTIGITLAGALAFTMLPVASLPQVDIPTIAVQAQLAGASPETMASTVATPLERALGRIAGVTELTSYSNLGSSRIILQFDLDRPVNGAARDVQAAINGARSLLPTSLNRNPTYRKVNPADAPVMDISLTSDTMTTAQIYEVADSIVAQKFSQVEGIGQVDVDGGSQPSVRIELNPLALARYGISTETVRTAVSTTNANRPKGFVENDRRHWQIGANDQLKAATEYANLIIAVNKGVVVRLSDLATVKDSVQDVRNFGSANGKPAVLIHLRREPGANVIETIDRVKALLPQLKSSIPSAVDVSIVLDRTPSIRASLHEIETTLAISIGLVIFVVFVFLRNPRATLIPAVAVPVSLIATFAAMYLFGFSLDNLSLMALTVATGFVVDDAVVVLENVSRHIEDGLSPFESALQGAKEVGFTVLSMSISLVAVFIPVIMMGGLVGRFLSEFSITLAVAVLVSLVVSLTTTPMMCAYLLRSRKPDWAKKERKLARFARKILESMQSGYASSLAWALKFSPLMMLILLATVVLNVWLYTVVPKGFFPQQDSGRITGNIVADQAISYQAMLGKLNRYTEIIKADPAVQAFSAATGGGSRNTARMMIALKPASERDVTSDQFIERIRKKTSHETGSKLTLQADQDIRVGGRSSGAQYQYTLQADNLTDLRIWEPKIKEAFSKLPQLADVNTDSQDKGSQTMINVNRDAASRLGINMQKIDSTLNNLFGQRQISTIYNPLNQYKVVMEASPEFWQSPEALRDVQIIVPKADGTNTAVPLMTFASFGPTNTTLSVNHQGQFAASTLSFNLPEKVSLSDATLAINNEMKRIGVPDNVHGDFQGTAKIFKQSLSNQLWLIVAALLTIYIVLGVLYESYIHPLTIISTLPSAGVGALLALLLFEVEFNIMAMIGVLLLVGIVKKNAIMMIDFAINAERTRGLSSRDAIYEACQLRFRPIMMTTIAALLGALPLALGSGEGHELRQPLGIAIVGGLIFSQMLTLYTTPVVYLYLDRLSIWWRELLTPKLGRLSLKK